MLADEQDTHGTSIQRPFSYASEQEALDATRASCADAEQIRLRRFHDLEQSSQRYVQADLCAHSPPRLLQRRRNCSKLPLPLANSRRVDLRGFASKHRSHRAREQPGRRDGDGLDDVGQNDAGASAWLQARQKCCGLPSIGRPVHTDNDSPDVTSTPDDEDRTEGMPDHPARDAAHQQTSHRPVAAPAEHNDLRSESSCLSDDCLDRQSVDRRRVGVRPCPAQAATCAGGHALEMSTQRTDHRPPLSAPARAARNHRADSRVRRPGKGACHRDRGPGVLRPIRRHQDKKVARLRHHGPRCSLKTPRCAEARRSHTSESWITRVREALQRKLPTRVRARILHQER